MSLINLRQAAFAFLLLMSFSAPCIAGAISSCGTIISVPGNYWLDRDVDCTQYSQSGIIFSSSASGSTLDCRNHTLTGKGGHPGVGVRIDGASGVTITNCIVVGFFHGIGVGMASFLAPGGDGHTITGNTVTGSNWAGIYTYMTTGTKITGNTVFSNAGTAGIYIAFQSYSTSATGNTASDVSVIPSGDICQGFSANNSVIGNTLSCGIYTEDSLTSISGNKVCGSDGANKILCDFTSRCGLHGSSNISLFSANSCDIVTGCGIGPACHQCSGSVIKPINATRNESWITVPADAYLGTPAFSVMKYEARRVSDRPFSQADGQPWVGMNRYDAAASCEDRGPEYHLVTQREALALSRSIERTAINDIDASSSTVQFANGSTLNEGSITAADDPLITGCDISLPLSDAKNNATTGCQLRTTGYIGTNGSWAGERWHLRTHVLSNGEIIWDWAGNAWEWISASCMKSTGADCDNCYYGATSAPLDWLNANIGNFERTYAGPNSSSLGVANGTGTYTGCIADYDSLVRGGYNTTSSRPYVLSGDGIYALNMGLAPAASRDYLGFRCVRNIG
jgi:parallel beta-helix repeat protein